MGAPGNYILCPQGHVIGMIEDDLYWGEPEDESSVWKELEKFENSRCKVCGKMAKYSFCHYGDINDCLDSDHKLIWNSEEERYILPKSFVGKNMNVILKKDKKDSVLSDKIINLMIKRLKSAHIIMIDSDRIGNIKIPEVDEKVLFNIVRGGE